MHSAYKIGEILDCFAGYWSTCSTTCPNIDHLPLQPPAITGRYTGATFNFFIQPAQGEFRAVMGALSTMAQTAACALRGDGCGQYQQLKEDIAALETRRCVLTTC